MITVYGADWCKDTRRTLRLLRRLHVRYRYRNIDADLPTLERALVLTGGRRRTPIVDLGLGGEPLVEPSNQILTAALVEHDMLSPDDARERLRIQNAGDLERVGRTIAGLAIFLAAGALPRRMRRPLRVLGGITAATGVLGWCPAFQAAGVSSIGGPLDRPDEAERRNWLVTARRAAGAPTTARASRLAAESVRVPGARG